MIIAVLRRHLQVMQPLAERVDICLDLLDLAPQLRLQLGGRDLDEPVVRVSERPSSGIGAGLTERRKRKQGKIFPASKVSSVTEP